MREVFKMINSTDMVKKNCKMDLVMKANFLKDKNMGMENIHIVMDLYIKDSGIKIN